MEKRNPTGYLWFTEKFTARSVGMSRLGFSRFLAELGGSQYSQATLLNSFIFTSARDLPDYIPHSSPDGAQLAEPSLVDLKPA